MFVTKAVRSANGELIDDFQKIAKKADPKLSFIFCGGLVVSCEISDFSLKPREKGIDRIELCRESAQRTLPTIG